MRILTVIAISLAACAGNVDVNGNTRSFKTTRFSSSDPIYTDGVWSFDLQADKCNPQTYGDGRGESGCLGGRRLSQIRAPRHAMVGQEIEYGFEILIPSDFVYDGDPSFPAFSRLLIAEWKRERGIKNHLYEILLESRRGATFEREVCFGPSEFGKWNRFQLLIKWSGKGDGYIEARCNGRLVLDRKNLQTLVPPDCGAEYKLQCDPARQELSHDIIWAIGPNLSGYGRDFASLRSRPETPFPPFPPNGVKFKVRNIYVNNIRK